MADSGQFTATLRLTVGELKIAHPITVPSAAVPATEIVPALQGLVNAVVAAAEAGKAISCRKGCGACCRQLVPISRTEGERLLQLIEAMPAERRRALEQRFAAAAKRIEQANLFSSPPIGGEARRGSYRRSSTPPLPASPPSGGEEKEKRTDRELSLAYFALRVPCPFLEDESCSIHSDRPLVCREYLVTSPAELCAGPSQDGVTPVSVPKISPAARGLEESRPEADTSGRWFPLALLMEWAKTRPRGATRRPGPEWIQRFVRRIAAR
jgi:Fe-S-cluster containining protein